jgi:uncharacterized protein
MKKRGTMLTLVLLTCAWPLYAAHDGQSGIAESLAGKPMTQEATRSGMDTSKVVFHVDADQEEILMLALENMKNLFKAIPAETCQVCLVANGKAVKLFHKDRVGKHAADMEELHRAGVRFKACKNALAKNHIEKADLFPLCEIVPAGIVELIQLQAQGFAYIKP